jgi:hypothetical protein
VARNARKALPSVTIDMLVSAAEVRNSALMMMPKTTVVSSAKRMMLRMAWCPLNEGHPEAL